MHKLQYSLTQRFSSRMFILVLLGLLPFLALAVNLDPTKGPVLTNGHALQEFLAQPGHSVDVLIINKSGEVSLVTGFQQAQLMPPSPKLIEKLKAEGKLETLYKKLAAQKQKHANKNTPQIDQPAPLARHPLSSETNPVPAAFVGTVKALVLAADFSDNTATMSADAINNILFGNGSSLTNFYKAASFNQLFVLGTVAGWIRAPQTYAYYVDGQYGSGYYPKNSQGLVTDVCLAVDSILNFANYDGNHDGFVDALFLTHAGGGAEGSGDTTQIWSHAWSLPSALKLDGVKVYSYSVDPEYIYYPGDLTIGVYCHEVGHVFGLPDLYDYDYDANGIGSWSLMAAGSWNGNNGDQPAMPDAWCKTYLGWIRPTVIKSDLYNVMVPNAENNPKVFKLWTNGTASNEYFLVENRQKIGFDGSLPGWGMLIYHVDDNQSTNDNQYYPGHTGYGNYHVALEQADGQYMLDQSYYNRGDKGDPFPGSKSNRNFYSNTTPDSNAYSGATTKVGVVKISNSNSTMTASFLVGNTGSGCYDNYEPNDNVFDAYPISNYIWVSNTSYIDPKADQDWFRVQLETNSILSVVINAQSMGSKLDSYLEIFDANSTLLAKNNDFNGLDSLSVITASTTGTYYIKVTEYGNDTGGCNYYYVLKAFYWVDGFDPYENNDSINLSYTIPQNNWVSQRAYIKPAGDNDWFKVNLNANSVVTVSISAQTSGSKLNAALEVFNPSGTMIAYNDDANGLDPFIICTTQSAGNYFFRVFTTDTAASGNSYYYQMNIGWGWFCVDPYEPNDTMSQAAEIPSNYWRSQRAYISSTTDVDWFKVYLNTNSIVTVDVDAESLGSILDSQIYVYDSNGNQLVYNDDTGLSLGLDSFAEVTITTAGYYYITVSDRSRQHSGCDAYYQLKVSWASELKDVLNVKNFSIVPSYQNVGLTWQNPEYDTYQGTQAFRWDTTSGWVSRYWYNGTSLNDTNTTFGVKQNYAIFTHDTAYNYSPGIVGSVIKGSFRNIDQLSVSQGSSAIILGWINPAVSAYAGTLIVRRIDRFPVNPTDGTIVYWYNSKVFNDNNKIINDTTYYYGIFAHDKSQNFAPGVFVAVKAGSKSLTPKLVNTVSGYDYNAIRWENPSASNFSGTLIVRRTDRFPESPTDGSVVYWYNGTGFVDRSLTIGQKYFYGIYSHDTAINFAPALKVALIPSSFVNVKNVSDTPGNGRVTLSWNNPTDMPFVGSLVVRREDRYPTGPFDGTLKYWANGQLATDTGLTNGKKYYYGIFAHDSVYNFSPGIMVATMPSRNVPLPVAQGSMWVDANISNGFKPAAVAGLDLSPKWFNQLADFDSNADLNYWGYEASGAKAGWLKAADGQSGLVQLGIPDSGAGKFTSSVRLAANANNSWYKVKVTSKGSAEVTPIAILYAKDGDKITGVAEPVHKSTNVVDSWNITEAYLYCTEPMFQVQLVLIGQAGTVLVDSVELENSAPPAGVKVPTTSKYASTQVTHYDVNPLMTAESGNSGWLTLAE